MNTEELSQLICTRLRNAGLPKSILAEFLDVVDSTIDGYLTEAPGRHHPPKGSNLNALWHLMAFAGISSPELDRVDAFGRYLGELLAWRIVELPDAVEICGLTPTNLQGAWRATRSPNPPYGPKFSLDALHELYDGTLDDSKVKLHRKLDGYMPPAGLRALEPISTNSAPPTVNQPTTPPKVVPVSATQVVMRAEETLSSEPASIADHTRYLVQIASDVSALLPQLRYLLVHCTPEERALVRKLLNDTGMFELAHLADQLCGERAKTMMGAK